MMERLNLARMITDNQTGPLRNLELGSQLLACFKRRIDIDTNIRLRQQLSKVLTGQSVSNDSIPTLFTRANEDRQRLVFLPSEFLCRSIVGVP